MLTIGSYIRKNYPLSLKELSQRCALEEDTMRDILYNSKPIDKDIAESLSSGIGEDIHDWLNLQQQYNIITWFDNILNRCAIR